MRNIKLFEEYSKENKNPYIYDNPELVKMIEDIIEEDASFICTWVSSAIKMLEGDDIKIYGFSTEENPESEYFMEENGEDSDEGHHFAVMNDRYIIDPWIYNNYYNYPNTFNRSVFDLQNKDDEEIIKYIYGDKNNWTDLTKYVEHDYNFKKHFPKTYQKLLDYYKNFTNN